MAASRTVRSEDAPDAEVPDHEAPVGDVERRTLFSAHYTAERTGTGLHLDVTVREQGEAPPDRLPRVMDGVVRRSGDDLGEPREVEIGGDVDRFETLMDEFDPGLFEEPAQPMPASQS